MNNQVLYPDGTYHCQACGIEISEELVNFTYTLTGYAFCHEHKDKFLEFRSELEKRLIFDGKEFDLVKK